MQYHIGKSLPGAKLIASPKLKTVPFGVFETTNGADLLKLRLPPRRDLVPGIIPAGVSVLAGIPKQGKTRVAMGISLAVAGAGSFAGRSVGRSGRVLYFALEEGRGLVQDRLKEFCPDHKPAVSLDLVFNSNGSPVETLSAMRDWAQCHHDAALVVIDVWAIFCRNGRTARTYADEYKLLYLVAEFSSATGIPVILVTHATKAMTQKGDPRSVAGTIAQIASPDSIILVHEVGGAMELHIKSRLMMSTQVTVRFDAMSRSWIEAAKNLSDFDDPAADRTSQVLALFVGKAELTSKDIAKAVFDENSNAAGAHLSRMVTARKLRRLSKGKFALPT